MPRLAASLLALLLVAGLAPAAASAAPARPVAVQVPPPAAATILEGIDVSHWQGSITWSKVAAAGKKFAFIKASEDVDFVDDQYLVNRSGAQAVGIWTGAYHFARPDSSANDAVNEADHFVATVRLGVHDLVPVLDLEDSGGLSVPALQAWVTAWLNRVWSRTSVRPMIYVSPAFWKKYMGDTRVLADAGFDALWIAHWGVSSPTVAASNWGGQGWTFWQYSNAGSVPGIAGRVDLDRFSGADLGSVAYSIFNLAGKNGAQVKQGQTAAAATVGIARTNFTSGVDFDVSGLPAGASATFDAEPVTGASTTMRVTAATTTPIGSYRVLINGSGEGLTRTTAVMVNVVDGIAPSVVAPALWLEPATTLGSTTMPVFATWSATDPSGIASYGVQRSANGGAWTSVALSKATATNGYQSVPMGVAVRVQARATDRFANTSAWKPGPSVGSLITQQTAGSIAYHGTWTSQSTSSASGGSLRYGRFAGASATYTFTGSSVGWVAARGPDRGSARVYVDGVYAATVNLQSRSTSYRSVVFARNFGKTGAHTLRIVVVGTKGHSRVDVDAFIRLGIN